MSTTFNVTLPPGLPIPPGITLPPRYDARESADWVDGLAGLKTSIRLSPGIRVNGSGMIGGGGSKFSSDLYGALAFQLGRNTSLQVGYRHLTMDFTSNTNFKIDATMHGPLLGFGITF